PHTYIDTLPGSRGSSATTSPFAVSNKRSIPPTLEAMLVQFGPYRGRTAPTFVSGPGAARPRRHAGPGAARPRPDHRAGPGPARSTATRQTTTGSDLRPRRTKWSRYSTSAAGTASSNVG